MPNLHPLFSDILSAIDKSVAKTELWTDRRTIHLDVLIKRPPDEGAQATVVDLDNFFSPQQRARLEAVLSCLCEERLAEDQS